MKALVIGATGATGKDLIPDLLLDETYTEVVAFVRRASGINHPKLKEIVTDFDQLEQVRTLITGEVLFSCLGTTLKEAGTKERQFHVDFEIPSQFARLARENGVMKMVLLSAYGASASSSVFYSKIKGQLEDAVTALGFDTLVIFRPGVLVRKDTDRAGEKISIRIIGLLNKIGLLRRFKPMRTTTLAEKLALAPKIYGKGIHIVSLSDIFRVKT